MRKWMLILLSFLAFACAGEVDYTPAPPGEEEELDDRKVKIVFALPAQTPMQTRALGEDGPDEPMQNLYLAVFGSTGYLKEYVQATPLGLLPDKWVYNDLDGVERSVDQYSYEVVLSLSDNTRYIHFIGNGPSSITFGYASNVMPMLLSENGERAYWQMITVPHIMARKSKEKDIYVDGKGNEVFPGDFIDADGNKITDGTGYVADDETLGFFAHIPLVRNWAKIVVMKDLVTDEETGLPNDPYFEPISYAVVNVPKRGAVAPHSAATGFISNYQDYGFADLENVLKYPANLPAGTVFDTTVPTAEDFENGTGGVVMVSDPDNAVYLYERPVPSDKIPASSVIVYGTYLNPDPEESAYYGKNYFYKVDMMENAEYYPIYRNFKYQVLIHKIRSHGHYSPAAAAAAAGSADVSADINTSSLNDISDGDARLVIRPDMARTFILPQTDNTMYSAYFMKDVHEGIVDMDPSSVTVALLPRSYGGEDIIHDLSIDAPETSGEETGWRTIHFSTVSPGLAISTQTIRVQGNYKSSAGKKMRLYRDLVITVQQKQPMIVKCGKEKVANLKGSEQWLDISIPDGLVESMFPLHFQIEAEALTLTPDDSKPNNNLPVDSGESLSGSGKPAFHFVRTLSWDEYRSLTLTMDDDDFSWRTFTCYFKTNRDESSTNILVTNEFFNSASDSFYTFVDDEFRKLWFSSTIPATEDAPVSVDITMREDPGHTYPDDFPVVMMTMSGVRPSPDSDVVYDEYLRKWVFRPTQADMTLEFLTTDTGGDVVITFQADGYLETTIRSCKFSNVLLVDGHPLKSGGNSNVVLGHVNRDANKTILLQYYEDPNGMGVPVWIKDLQGLVYNSPASGSFPTVGLQNNDASSKLFREIDFKTPKTRSADPVSLTLCANGYAEFPISVGRFDGNFYTKDYGYTALSTSNTSVNVVIDSNHGCDVTFSEISDIKGKGSSPEGIILDAGGTYTVTFSLNGAADRKLYYVHFIMRPNYNWNGTKQDLFPVSVTPSVGTYSRWGNNSTDFIWNIPANTREASITFQASESCPINISGFNIKTYRGTFN